MYVGIITRFVYGISGNELSPPVKDKIKTAYLLNVETMEEARQIMADKAIPLRRAADNAEIRPYSHRDSIDWDVIMIAEDIDSG